MRLFLIAILLIHTAVVFAADGVHGIGYRYDGSGVFPVESLPTRFAPASGEGVAWCTPLPNFSLSSPIVVDGRVYTMCERTQSLEPELLFPTLICLDADSGEILWQTEIDHVRAMAGGEADRILALWRRELIAHAVLFRTRYLVNSEKSMSVAEGTAALEAVGWEAKSSRKKGGLYGDLPRKGEREKTRDMLADTYNLWWSNWHRSGKWGGPHIGISFPTPVSDGEDIYVATGFNTIACVSKQGAIKWMRFLPTDNTQPKARFVPSPLIVDGVLVVTMDRRVRGFDRSTGELLWETATAWPHIYACGSAVPIQIGETAAVFTTSGHVVRVRDGAILADGLGFQGSGHPPTSDGHRAVFFTNQSEGGSYRGSGGFCDEGTYAIRLDPTEDGVKPALLWKRTGDERVDQPFLVGSHLYAGDLVVLDPLTGKQVGGCRAPQGTKPAQAWVGTPRALVGLGKQGKGGSAWLTVIATGNGSPQVVCQGEIPPAPAEGVVRERRMCEISRAEWTLPANTVPFLTEGRIYVRTMDHLWCIGR